MAKLRPLRVLTGRAPLSRSQGLRSMLNDGARPRWLVFAVGNPSRGDDALGPLLVERLEQWSATARALPVELVLLTDFQWQVENALDLQGVDVAIFADASVSGGTSFDIAPLSPQFDASYSTHALSPACVLAVAARLEQKLPQAWLLSMPGWISSSARRSATGPDRRSTAPSSIFAQASSRAGSKPPAPLRADRRARSAGVRNALKMSLTVRVPFQEPLRLRRAPHR